MHRDSFEAFSQGKEDKYPEPEETPQDALENCNTTFLLEEE